MAKIICHLFRFYVNMHVVETFLKLILRLTCLHIKVRLTQAFKMKRKEKEKRKLTLRKVQKMRTEIQRAKVHSTNLFDKGRLILIF